MNVKFFFDTEKLTIKNIGDIGVTKIRFVEFISEGVSAMSAYISAWGSTGITGELIELSTDTEEE